MSEITYSPSTAYYMSRGIHFGDFLRSPARDGYDVFLTKGDLTVMVEADRYGRGNFLECAANLCMREVIGLDVMMLPMDADHGCGD